jgi:hypothetical protein
MERPDLERTMEQVLPYGKSITGKQDKLFKLVLVTIFKSENPKLPQNYRGIAVANCFGRIFNSILNNCKVHLYQHFYYFSGMKWLCVFL